MKILLPVFFSLAILIGCANSESENTFTEDPNAPEKVEDMTPEKQLRHVVMFKFKEESTEEDIQMVVDAFAALPALIPEIRGFEWGTNNSPEGLDKGFTHCFLLTFHSEEDREIYLPHPDHKAFGEKIGPHIDDVMVLDYWLN